MMPLLAQEKTLNETMSTFLLNSHTDERMWQHFLKELRAQEGRLSREKSKIVPFT